MERKFDAIKDINGKKQTLKLVVGITHLWYVQNQNKKSLKMIILDFKRY